MKTDNQALLSVEQAITAKVPPALMKQFNRLVLAGSKLMYADETEPMLRKQMKDGTPAQAAGRGAAKLLGLLLARSNGKPDKKALVPAGIMLLLEALDFMEKAGKVKVTPEIVAEATQEFGPALLQLMGVTPDKLTQMMGQMDQGDQQKQAGQPAPQPQQQPPQPQHAQQPMPQRPAAMPLIGAQQ